MLSPTKINPPAVMPATPLPQRTFDLSRVRGLSPKALDTHISLYETYVREANGLLELLHGFPRAYDLPAAERVQRDGLVRRLAFEMNGVAFHESFFEILGESVPLAAGKFQAAVNAGFGDFSGWKRDVIELAQTRGVGWVVTCNVAGGKRLLNLWIDDHTRGLLPGVTPLAVFDLWEHAFMFDFKASQRAAYIEVLFDNINWGVVESRCT